MNATGHAHSFRAGGHGGLFQLWCVGVSRGVLADSALAYVHGSPSHRPLRILCRLILHTL